MLYLGTALKSTAITHAITIPNLLSSSLPTTSSNNLSSSDEPPTLVVAKGNLLEIHHPTEYGLVKVGETDVWGMIVGLEWVFEGGKPGIVVMTDHPIARLLLYTIHATSSTSPDSLPSVTLHLSSAHNITRPSSRPAEFFTGLVVDREEGVVVGSLYTGVLNVVEVGAAKESGGGVGKGKRKQSLGMGTVEEEEGGEMVFGEVYEINVREHNLLSLAFLIPRTSRRSSTPSSRRNHSPILNFLFLTPQYTLQLLPRRLNRSKRTFEDLVQPVDLLSGKGFVPAAKKLVGVRGGVVVIGDEWSKLFEMGFVSGSGSPSTSGRRLSGTRRESITSPTSKMLALSTSPESEKRSTESHKRRKGSVGGSVVPNVGTGVGSAPSVGNTTVAGSESMFVVRDGWRVRQGFGEISAATVVSSEGGNQALFMGDDFGRLTMLQFEIGKKDSAVVSSMGVTSAPTAICHLDGPYIFIASQCGDSQLLSIQRSSTKGKAKEEDSMQVDEEPTRFEVLENLSNIGPVNDFCVVEDEGGGSSQLVTASGLSSTGSLRTIRSGLGTTDIAIIEGLEDVTDLYTVESKSLSLHLLYASSLSSTQIFQIEASSAGDFSLLPVSELLAKAPTAHRTIAVGLMGDQVLVQVTNIAVQAINVRTGAECGSWSGYSEGDELVKATFAAPHVILATGKGELYTLTMVEDGSVQNVVMAPTQDSLNEVSCLDAGFINGSTQALVAIGRWGSNEVSLYAMPDLRLLGEPKCEVSHPASVRIHNSQVLVGLGNGTLVTYDIKSSDSPELGARRVLSLGVEPLLLASCALDLEIDGDKQIVALAERVSVVYSERGRMLASSISGKGVTAVTSLHLPSIGSCIILASADGLVVKQVTSLKQLQMRKVDLGYDSPTGIAHHRGLQAYGVSINRTTLERELGNEERSSFFRLYDDTNLRPVAELPLPSREEIVSLNLVTLSGRTFFSLGTVLPAIPTDVHSVPRGFIRLIEGINDETFGYKLDLVAELDVGGPARDSKAIWDQLVVAVDNRVELLSFSSLDSEPQSALSLTSSWGNAFFASCLTVQQIPQSDGTTKERLHVGDGMRSVFALERNGKGELQDVGRDITPHWVLTMEELESQGGGVIFADTSYNLLTIRHKDNHLENAAGIALHETAARFRRGTFAPSFAKREAIRPELLFATTSGALGVIADLGDTESKVLSDLQRNMDEVCSGPGITWRAYREIHTEGSGKPRNTLGFIDGDFVKRFLDLSTDDKGLNVTRVLAGSNDFERVGLGVGKGGGPVEAADVVRILEAAGSMH